MRYALLICWLVAAHTVPAAQDRAWGAAFTLIMIVFIFTIIARVVSSRFATKTQ